MATLKRRSNNINCAQFWEYYQFNKYNFEPGYQREADVWTQSKQSFLIDSVLKNFPMPPIFLHEHIDPDNGKTVFDVIDGKQRLSAIIAFIKNEISIPNDFGEDGYGESKLSGLFFKDLDNEEFKEWKKSFWKYEISIEYIDSDQDNEIVNNIFDRLNRNGEPLNAQELRKAKYGGTMLYNLVQDLSQIDFWNDNLQKLNVNRYDNIEFVSELLFLVLEEKVFESSKRVIDDEYDKYCKGENMLNSEHVLTVEKQFHAITEIVKSFDLNLRSFQIDGVSHLYGLWGLAWQLNKRSIPNSFSNELNSFYTKLRSKDFTSPEVKDYSLSMQSGTKSKGQRIKRINALLSYCGLSELDGN